MKSFTARGLEHMGHWVLTNIPVSWPNFRSIREHAKKFVHPISHSDFTIL